TKDSNGNSNILSWNLNLTASEFMLDMTWDRSPPGWVQRGNGAVQIAMFTYPHNGNAQVPWVISSPNNTTYNFSSWNGEIFVAEPGALGYSLTDHYVASVLLGVYRWDDDTSSWNPYIGFETTDANGGTGIIQKIARSDGITLNSGTFVGPSQLWGIDNTGAVFSAGPPPVMPR